MPQEAIINLGDRSQPYEIDGPRLRERTDDLDQLTLNYAASTKEAFVRDTAAPSPWSGFTIVDLDKELDGDEWIFNLQCEGIQGGGERVIGKMTPVNNLEDWDTVSFEVLTTNPNKYVVGQYLPGPWQIMLCTTSYPKYARGVWYRLQVSGQGLIRPKERFRSITCNGQTISGDAVTWNLPGGWNTPQKGVVDLPSIQVVDTYFGTVAPPTGDVPGSKNPPATPPLRNLGNVVINNAVRYWPNGWKFSTAGKQLGNSSLWQTQWIYTVQWAALPG
jgi:hypothetical protein